MPHLLWHRASVFAVLYEGRAQFSGLLRQAKEFINLNRNYPSIYYYLLPNTPDFVVLIRILSYFLLFSVNMFEQYIDQSVDRRIICPL